MAKKKQAPVERYVKQAILNDNYYRRYEALLKGLLKDGETYALSDVDKMIESVMKGKVI